MNTYVFVEVFQETGYVRAMFHPIISTLSILQISLPRGHLELGYEYTSVKEWNPRVTLSLIKPNLDLLLVLLSIQQNRIPS